MLAISVVPVLREEYARSYVKPSRGGVLAGMSKVALEVSSSSTKELSSTAGLALFRLRPLISGGCYTRSPSSSGDLLLGAISISGPPESSKVYKGRFGPSSFGVRGGEVRLSIAGTEIDYSQRKASV